MFVRYVESYTINIYKMSANIIWYLLKQLCVKTNRWIKVWKSATFAYNLLNKIQLCHESGSISDFKHKWKDNLIIIIDINTNLWIMIKPVFRDGVGVFYWWDTTCRLKLQCFQSKNVKKTRVKRVKNH